MKKLTDGQAGYIAGFVEGEGSFTIGAQVDRRRNRSKPSLAPKITIVQKDPTALTYIRRLVGAGRVEYRARQGRKGTPIYVYHLSNREPIMDLIKLMFPYFQSKRTKKRAWCVYNMAKRRNGRAPYPISDEEWNKRIKIYNIWSTTSRRKLQIKEVR